MQSFSQRKGIKPQKSMMQVDYMDDALRAGLWNAFTTLYKNTPGTRITGTRMYIDDSRSLYELIWIEHFKKPLDNLVSLLVENEVREFFLHAEWNEVYDLLEFIVNNFGNTSINELFIEECNRVLKREMAPYRFINGVITQIVDEEVIASIQKAANLPDKFASVRIHLKRALDLLSDKTSPDYRNSIKESISGLEALCRIIVARSNASLGDAIKLISTSTPIHPSLKEGILKIYGYTSDAGGIRHSLKDEITPDFDDAIFMLTSCSALINYIIAKNAKSEG